MFVPKDRPMTQDALTRRFLESRNSLFSYLLALSGDPAVSEEVFQEIGISVLRESARGVEPADPDAWLRGVARNRLADHYRAEKRKHTREIGFDAFADVVDRAFAEHPPTAADPEDIPRLRACLERLAPRARSIVDARYRDDQGLDEIAEDLGWTINSVKVALSRARKALGECISRRRLSTG